MYSNEILNFQESTTILNAWTKKMETYWIHHVRACMCICKDVSSCELTISIYIYIYICVCVCVCACVCACACFLCVYVWICIHIRGLEIFAFVCVCKHTLNMCNIDVHVLRRSYFVHWPSGWETIFIYFSPSKWSRIRLRRPIKPQLKKS